MNTASFTHRILNRQMSILMLICMLSCSFIWVSCGGNSGGAAAETAAEEVVEEEGTLSFTEEDIEALKAKFTVDESGWYNHTLWGNNLISRRTLTALVNASGYFALSSNYYAEKPLKHIQVKVKVGDAEKHWNPTKSNWVLLTTRSRA